MYKLYVFYAYAILGKRRGYTLLRAKKFFGKYFDEFQRIYDQMYKMFSDQARIKGALTIEQWREGIKQVKKDLVEMSKEISELEKLEPGTVYEGAGSYILGDKWQVEMKNVFEYIDEDLPIEERGPLAGYVHRGVQVRYNPNKPDPNAIYDHKRLREMAKTWEIMEIPGLKAINQNPGWYPDTKENLKVISNFIGQAYKDQVVKKNTAEGIAGAILIQLINL